MNQDLRFLRDTLVAHFIDETVLHLIRKTVVSFNKNPLLVDS